MALIDHGEDGWLAWLVLTAGLLLQIAVNLINDYLNLENATLDLATQQSIRRNVKIGWAVMLLAVSV
ncbi:MAG: hypothetical protein KZQ66_04865 [Candidatus Thiodiazotropha sp. (ex Lucinoma aequizonata)]|nr:hypothetical protein [Candidatus Thiodiazotropha sp. (ex Lucinoma aequizonata)]MCU7889998.1 hypothetical protein [Candidatus Thiodiazotropha sp. (ex Lucinoma aequizonata)]MCU7897124.1 hypothetical protein [Candidatus Thiodiazotropha sp. (ex Lucinoma aequizonata)]MCU7899365.1 hypothetical protein [Candidatus Thiodiazotropha sp. (ex Lucinoma aequizonata)]MCU7901405.1 hypothetical protein [Candidatus Thiodiazotropha sp. (ex Lucinoma aequizonata)]